MQRPAFQDVAGRDPALRQPSLGQQHPQVPAVGLIDLGVPLAAAGEGGVGRPGQMRRDPGRGQLLDDIPPPGTPLNRERDILAAVPRLFMSTWKSDLLPVDIQPAYRLPELALLPCVGPLGLDGAVKLTSRSRERHDVPPWRAERGGRGRERNKGRDHDCIRR